MIETNDENTSFYETIGHSRLEATAVAGGFDTWKDLEIARTYFAPEDSILEIGAGYGRILDGLLDGGHAGPIFAIEKSAELFRFLEAKFAARPNLTLARSDVRNLDISQPIDVALWMWSGFCDFSSDEQREACARLHGLLTEHGRVIIDVPCPGTTTVAEHLDAKNVRKQTPYGTLLAYIPDATDLEIIRSRCGYDRVLRSEYMTTTGRARTMFVLVK